MESSEAGNFVCRYRILGHLHTYANSDSRCSVSTVSFSHRVSSVLNNDSRSYGKRNMFDGNEETCWNSAEVHL